MRVALYIRRSTNERLQADSVKVQDEILKTYAREHGMEVVETFVDSASGTSTKHRAAFLRMVEKITHGAEFTGVLVRDISRLGRFFDMDEGAFFEILFLAHGVKTIYCEETFGADTSPMAGLVKSVRRVMASEYSRDRSRLVRYAQSRATRLGFHATGPAPFGLRRVMVTPQGKVVRELRPGEWKALSNYRVRLAPGDPAAVETVKRIFDLYDHDDEGSTAIAKSLNDAAMPSPGGGRWYEPEILRILGNSLYAGLGHYRPKRRSLTDPLPAEHVEGLTVVAAPGHAGIVDEEQFRRVEARLARRIHRRSNADLAADARAAFEANGCVEPAMLKRLPLHASWGTYSNRFHGGIYEALEQAYDEEMAERKAGLLPLIREHVDVLEADGLWVVARSARIRFQLAFPHRRRHGVFWLIRRPPVEYDLVVASCLDPAESGPGELLLVRADQLDCRTQGLYLRKGRSTRRARCRVTPETLPARMADARYGQGSTTEAAFLSEARRQPLLSFATLARDLGWPYHTVRRTYRRLEARGEWFPPLSYGAGRRVEVVCVQCGKTRRTEPKRALVLKTGKCFDCTTKRPRRCVAVRCPKCGAEREKWPSAVRRLAAGAETECRSCSARRMLAARATAS
ncbi:recombinase family protein [Acidobacteria bacterium ACD]|nr:recombinase family protein [Acidobacteria bacterium ACB2]MDL1948630.1 recombinase family protein [Acidobacteria bacterium ACD]